MDFILLPFRIKIMYKKIILLIGLIFGCTISYSQVTFNKTYNSLVDATNNVLVSDSGYYFPMSSGQPILPRLLCFVKMDIKGDTLFQKYY